MQQRTRLSLLLIVLTFVALLGLVACGGETPAVTESAPEEPAVVEPTEEPAAAAPTEEPATAAPTEAPPTEAPPTEEPTAEAEATQETAAAPEDTVAAVRDALQEQLNAGPWRITQEIESDDMPAGAFNSVVEFVAPDRFHVTIMSDGQTVLESIIIGDAFYQNLGGTWTEAPVDLGSTMPGFLPDEETLANAEANFQDVEYLGAEELDGVPTRVYRYVVTDTTDGVPTEATITMWVRESDNLPIQQLIETEVEGVAASIRQTIEYDESITIEPPL